MVKICSIFDTAEHYFLVFCMKHSFPVATKKGNEIH
jgi:hypothetical protein